MRNVRDAKIKVLLALVVLFFSISQPIVGRGNEFGEDVLSSPAIREFRFAASRVTIRASERGMTYSGSNRVPPIVLDLHPISLSEEDVLAITRMVKERDMGTVVIVQPLGFSIVWIFSYSSEGKGTEFFAVRNVFETGKQPDNLRWKILDETVIDFTILDL